MSHAHLCFPSEFPYDIQPSSEDADAEEDFFAALTRRLTHHHLPVSATPFQFHQHNHPWDVIYAAAGQVARLKLNNNTTTPFPRTFNQEVKVSPLPKQCGSNRAREFGHQSLNVKCSPPLCSPQSAWPPLQHNNRPHFSGSGSRVVPAGSSVKRGCAGTGVFLPRHYETPSESRHKTGSAPVLLPAKVVHALNLNIDELNGAGHQRFFNAFAADYEAALARRNALLMQQRLTLLRREEAANYETRLPQEWTY